MEIKHLYLKTNKLSELKKFYQDLLNFIVIRENHFSLTLRLENIFLTLENTKEDTFYHFAFGINELLYPILMEKINQSIEPIKDSDGQQEFESGLWKRKQVYYYDPQGNIIEFLKNQDTRILEIGMPVSNINSFINSLQSINNIYKQASDNFSFYGDENGVFVITKVGRPWFPTQLACSIHPIKVEVDASLSLSFPEYSYNIN
ncbi:VOC family protein [Bacillus sp. CGMCC 1.16607]|uniref:VOC family protein n=1 Tax=Bacillus sp. CGMCC 1.16607 TaxID=3351842 RepID=UPI0036380BC5